MTLATSAAPLNTNRRDTSISGTRAVVSSQQLTGPSHCCRACDQPRLYARPAPGHTIVCAVMAASNRNSMAGCRGSGLFENPSDPLRRKAELNQRDAAVEDIPVMRDQASAETEL